MEIDEEIELRAQVLEYEHALEHVTDAETHKKYNMSFCEDCVKLAKSALDGHNREDFKEVVREDL